MLLSGVSVGKGQRKAVYKRNGQENITKPLTWVVTTSDDFPIDMAEITFEGFEYLEDTNTGKVYSLGYEHLGNGTTTVTRSFWVNAQRFNGLNSSVFCGFQMGAMTIRPPPLPHFSPRGILCQTVGLFRLFRPLDR